VFQKFMTKLLRHPKVELLLDEHFSVDGTLQDLPFLPLIFLPLSKPGGSNPPFSALLTLWLSMVAAVGLACCAAGPSGSHATGSRC
jgi:hypothetical protein